MKKNRIQMLALMIMFYLLLFLSIIFDSRFLILICVALLVFYFAFKKSYTVNKRTNFATSSTSDSNYFRGVRFLFIFICIPFIIIGISIFISGLIEYDNFLIFFGLFFFTIPLIILISSIAIISRMKRISFDESEPSNIKQKKMPLLFKVDPHMEHDSFLNDYSSKNKECFEHESKAKKKKKFKLFNEPEWDDENTHIDL